MNETQLLLSRVEDAIIDAEYGENGFLGFLNEMEAAQVSAYLKNRGVNYTLFGGYPQATRVYLGINQTGDESFPIEAILVTSKGNRALSHRDYLGSLMGLGIKRECVGDIILLSDYESVIFVRSELVSHITRDLDKVGRDRVSVSVYSGDTSNLSSEKEELRIIVSSMRIDNVVSSLVNCSRNKATEFIAQDCVFCNYLQVKKPSLTVAEGDILSIRGYGKFIIGKNTGRSKRDNLFISVMHYV